MIKVTFVQDVYQSPDKQFAMVLIHKNASTSVQGMVKSLGWKRIPKIASEAKIIAVLQDPIVRWMKGMVQIGKTEPGIYDNHTCPISLAHHDIFDHIHFIPLDHPTLTLPEAIWMETGLEVKDYCFNPTEDKEHQAEIFAILRQQQNELPRRQQMSELFKWDIRAYNAMKMAWNY